MKKTILTLLFAALTLGAYAGNDSCSKCSTADKEKTPCGCGAKTADECKQHCGDKCTKGCSEKPAEQPKKP